jgi:hypothetical protein
MKTILYLVSFIIFFNYSAYSEEWVDIYSKSGDKLLVALPDGYCDISHTDTGQFLLNEINKTITNITEYKHAKPKIVYNLCSQNFGYPWGYILLNNEKHSSSYTQIELNKNESASFNKNFTKKIKEKVNKSHDINRENIKINAMDKPELIWEDENALIAYIRASTNVEGITHVEEIIASTILYNNYALYMYILQIEGSDNALNDAQLLLHAAKVTKSR